MRDERWLTGEDRAVSSAVNHSIALGITAILISGLLIASGSMIEDQRRYSVQEQLQTVGNRIADELTRASAMAQDGGNVTITSRQPREIAGSSYTVELLTGPSCQTAIVSADTCLRLGLAEDNTEVTVPVRNETAVALDASTTGTFTITAIRNDSAGAKSVVGIERDLRVGIGDDVSQYSQGSNVNLTNRDPISGFTFSPGRPTVDSVIHFENDTKDLDGKIVAYEWELGDGATKTNVSEFNYSYSSPGTYTVTLTVTDDDGETDNVSKVVSVAGLVYNGGLSAIDVRSGVADDGLTFSIQNKHGAQVEIQELLVDPTNDSIDELDANNNGDEIEIAGDDATGGEDDPIDIYDDGRIYDIETEGYGPSRLSATSTANTWFRGFLDGGDNEVDMAGEEVFVAMHYRVGGSFYTSQFTLNGGGGSGNEAPDPAFSASCTDKECQFDGSASNDDGTIDDYEWDFDDGNTTSGPSLDELNHTYAANGSYDVSLTVTDDDGVSSTLTKTVDVGGVNPVVVWAVNSGGNQYTDGAGITYDKDTTSDTHDDLTGSDNNDYTTGDSIGGTTDDPLYQSERYGDFGYDVDVTNGEFEVTFKLAEIWFSSDNQRIFDVELEGNNVIVDLDIHDQVGHDSAMEITRTVTVDDGTLDIWFDTDEDNAKSSAIVVRRVDADAFQENDTTGVVSMEAENYMQKVSGSDDDWSGSDMSNDEWVTISDGGASGGTGLEAEPNNGDNSQDTTNGERLDYFVEFDNTGTYNVWVRMECPNGNSDSIHVGLDGTPESYGDVGLTSNDGTGCAGQSGWTWVSDADGDQVTVDVTSTEQHTFNVWMREDGTRIDKIVLKQTSSDPSGTGPTESDIE